MVELYFHLKKDKNQLTYYASGVGTHADDPDAGRVTRLVHRLRHTWDMLTASYVFLHLSLRLLSILELGKASQGRDNARIPMVV